MWAHTPAVTLCVIIGHCLVSQRQHASTREKGSQVYRNPAPLSLLCVASPVSVRQESNVVILFTLLSTGHLYQTKWRLLHCGFLFLLLGPSLLSVMITLNSPNICWDRETTLLKRVKRSHTDCKLHLEVKLKASVTCRVAIHTKIYFVFHTKFKHACSSSLLKGPVCRI